MHTLAVALCGNIRTWEITKTSFLDMCRTYLGYGFMVHVYIVTSSLKYNYHPFVAQQLDYKEEEVTTQHLERIKDFLFNNNITVVSAVITKEKTPEEAQAEIYEEPMRSFYHGYLQYQRLDEAVDLIEDFEERCRFRYDHILKTRFDLRYHIHNLPYPNEYDSVYLDQNNVFPNDHFILMSSLLLKGLVSFVLNQYRRTTSELSRVNPPHGLLEAYINLRNHKCILNNICQVVRE